MTTALADDELLVEARLPMLPAGTACGFYEFNRRAGDFAMAMALGLYRLDGGKIVEPRLAVGGAEVNPRRIAEAERALAGAAAGRRGVSRRRRRGDRRDRSDGGQHHQRRIPPRPRAGGDAPGARTRGGDEGA